MKKGIYVKKFYNKSDKYFYYCEYKFDGLDKNDIKKEIYSDLKSFAKGINYDFKGANLYYYEFNDKELEEYDFSDCIINSKYQKKLGMYNNRFYNKIMNKANAQTYDEPKTEIAKNDHNPFVSDNSFS